MAFLRNSRSDEAAPVIRSERLWLRAPVMSDHPAWAALRSASRQHLTPWEPQWSMDELARISFRRRLRHYSREIQDDTGYPMLIFRQSDDALLGGLTLSNIRRGVTQAGCLGYWLGAPHQGRGYMTEAVRALADFGFGNMKLHRLEAACLLHNAASIAVLERAGFTAEGVARRYLKINGQWQDHRLFARLSDDPVPALSPSVPASVQAPAPSPRRSTPSYDAKPSRQLSGGPT
jgi:[ribosomal protein S5]-alanine N-acetyltransferase